MREGERKDWKCPLGEASKTDNGEMEEMEERPRQWPREGLSLVTRESIVSEADIRILLY